MASTMSPPAVDTAHVQGRRKVRYHSHDEVLADVERLAASGYRQLGNWSLGQMARHLAAAMKMALDGSQDRVAWPMRLVAQLVFKKKVIQGPMRPGFKLPTKFAKTLIPDTAGDAEGIDDLRTTIQRWKNEPQRHPHPFFGKLTSEEWNKVVLNHDAMHMSFIVPN